MTDVVVTADELAEALLSGRPPVVLDVRWQLGDDAGFAHYQAGHVPGAVFVDLDAELAAPPAGAAGGRHPLPDIADLQAAARRWGISADVPVVVYDDSGNLAAARAWWLLRWAGLTEVRLLDGGLAAWRDSGFRLTHGDGGDIKPGTVTLSPGHLPTVDADAISAGVPLLLDARAAERYRGEVEPIDPRPGHIPGALSAPTGDNLTADGHFRTAQQLRDSFAQFGIEDDTEVTVYCGSGVTAAHEIAALAIAGLSATLYPGSYSEWSSDPGRPVNTGTAP